MASAIAQEPDQAMTGPAIRIAGVTRSYQRRGKEPRIAVNDLTLDIERSQWVALLGPNGSGKSTLMRMLVGLSEPDEGRIEVFGRSDGRDRREIASALGVVFQHASLDGLLTVRENLTAQAALYGLRGSRAAERVEREASRLHVEDRLDERVKSLSGGLARRVDLARALVHRPRILVLDEPTTGLDHAARTVFLDAIEDLREEPISIVMSTHMMDEAERADRVVMLDRGALVADGSPDRLRRDCGGRIVRCEVGTDGGARDRARGVIAESGLEPKDEHGNGLTATIPTDGESSAERVAAALARAGIAFEIGPPTLADAYLAKTGRRLEDEEAAS